MRSSARMRQGMRPMRLMIGAGASFTNLAQPASAPKSLTIKGLRPGGRAPDVNY